MKNVLVNVTLPKEVVDYLDQKADDQYTSRATVARQFLIEHTEEKKVVELRKKGFSYRKIAEMTGIKYDKILEIVRITRVDEDIDEELEKYMDEVMKDIIKKSKK